MQITPDDLQKLLSLIADLQAAKAALDDATSQSTAAARELAAKTPGAQEKWNSVRAATRDTPVTLQTATKALTEFARTVKITADEPAGGTAP